ncbi:MAG TPA: biotin carboxylase N-terminal domain-containing protein [Pseudolabrys sp.]|nr:biotin carboxylase N-terminal domain-containing protein [Pseudolabrys sp.]
MATEKVLIANRGEIACRIIRSCRKLGMSAVALFSDADANAMHVKLADEVYHLGPAPARESYLKGELIVEIARKAAARYVHPGYGFLAENAEFARAVEAAGLVWIGPRPASIDDMGDKECARKIAADAGVPVLPGSRRFAVNALEDVEAAASAVGYPLLVKAAAGGGGIGMRQVRTPAELLQEVKTTQSLAERSFGDGTVYLERFVAAARHIEIQVFGFGDGSAVHLFERDCSIQRRFQKIIEESPAPGLPDKVRERLAEAAVALCRHVSYRGAGTLEFVVDASSFEGYFIEMNTRIQVEHPVTEMVTGRDLVAMQLELARGSVRHIAQSEMRPRGHAIECRLYAENPDKNFLPSPGKLSVLELPAAGEGRRVDTGFQAGDTITPFYDPMIAKLISHGQDRREAIQIMREMLAETRIEGVKCNVDFLSRIMRDEDFVAGNITTNFLTDRRPALPAVPAHA